MKRMRALKGIAIAIGGAVSVLVNGAPRSTGNCTRSEMENQVDEVAVSLAYEKESWRNAIEDYREHNTRGGIIIDLSHCGLGNDGLEDLSSQVSDNVMDTVLQSADATNYPSLLYLALTFSLRAELAGKLLRRFTAGAQACAKC